MGLRDMTSPARSGLASAAGLGQPPWGSPVAGEALCSWSRRVLPSGHISHAAVYSSEFQSICSVPMACETLCLRPKGTKGIATAPTPWGLSLRWGWALNQERDAQALLKQRMTCPVREVHSRHCGSRMESSRGIEWFFRGESGVRRAHGS